MQDFQDYKVMLTIERITIQVEILFIFKKIFLFFWFFDMSMIWTHKNNVSKKEGNLDTLKKHVQDVDISKKRVHGLDISLGK